MCALRVLSVTLSRKQKAVQESYNKKKTLHRQAEQKIIYMVEQSFAAQPKY